MNLKRILFAIAVSASAGILPAFGQLSRGGPEVSARGNLRATSGGLQFSSNDQFNGSVASGQATPGAIDLSMKDTIDRGLKANLGLLVRGTLASGARADRLRALSALLPNLSAGFTQTEAQIDLAVYGFKAAGFPTVVGPFHYTDVRAAGSSALFDWTAYKSLKTAAENARASELSVEDGRDLVVQSVAAGYFTILADVGRVASTREQAQTAEALYNIARDRHSAGVSAAIDELRAQVEFKSQQERVVAAENVLARDKLQLARVIGLPAGQEFRLSDEAPYVALENLSTENLVQRAYETRADYRSAQAQVRAAELARQAADAERYPTAYVSADYGVVGQALNNSHGTFTVSGSVNINIFDGGRIRSDQQATSAEIERRRNELADLRGKIDFEVRSAMLDLSTAAEQVGLARSNLDLANQTLNQARDRFSAGVADTIEVVQAQEAVAGASQDAINSLYAHNLAKVSLARAVGATEASLRQFLEGR